MSSSRKRPYAKFLRGKCEVEKIDVVVQVVTVRSWVSLNDAFEEAANQIPAAGYLWDVKVSESADQGKELKLYFFKEIFKRPNAEVKPGPKERRK